MDHMERLTQVYEAGDAYEGHFLKDLLTSNGIEAHLTDENSVYAGVGGIQRPKLWVFESDERAARELITQYETTRNETASDSPAGDDSITPGAPDAGRL